MDQNNIFKLIRTAHEQNELISLIEKLLENNFKEELTPSEEILNSSFARILWNAISSALVGGNISGNKKETEKFLDSLLIKTKSLNKLKITIAFEPKDALLESLSKWAGSNLSGNVIFDFKLDPQILGGAIIASDKGEYADFSLSKKINDLFLQQKQEILSLL